MPRKSDSIPINNPSLDKRVKLTEKAKRKIREEYETGLISQRALATKYKVSRRTIQFVLDPEKLERNKRLFAENQKDGRYYNKEKHTKSVYDHREYKKELLKKGLLKTEEGE